MRDEESKLIRKILLFQFYIQLALKICMYFFFRGQNTDFL